MSVDIRSSDRRRYISELQAREKEIAAGLHKASQPASPKALQENEKRIRREIANSNERRRMQCINAGFSNLRALIPQLEGEKLSKAAILQHATEYITSMEKDKTRLQIQLDHTKRLLSELGQDRIVADAYVSSSPPPSKRKKRDTESSDDGVGSLSDASDESGSDLQRENVALRHQLELERQRCATLEEHVCILEKELLACLNPVVASTANDLHPSRLDHSHEHFDQQDAPYNRKVIEVAATPEAIVSTAREENTQSVPLSCQKHEPGMAVEVSVPIDATVHKSSLDSSSYCGLKLERVPASEASTPSVVQPSGEAHAAVRVSTDHHHHEIYSHLNHPRRRHRHQVQLEQRRAEEEQRRQLEEHEKSINRPTLYWPKHSTQNLENLVEAIRQIEGDRILSDEQKFYEEKHKLYDHHRCLRNPEESEREMSSVSDQDELRSESSGRDSPLQHHLHHQKHQQPVIITSQRLTSTSSASSESLKSVVSNSSSFSEKYPIAAHLLHRPVQVSYYRPGVIVHKL